MKHKVITFNGEPKITSVIYDEGLYHSGECAASYEVPEAETIEEKT